MDVIDRRMLMGRVLAQMAGSVWKTKSFTVNVAGTNALALKTMLDQEMPNEYSIAFIANDNQDWSSYADKQFIYAVYFKNKSDLNNFYRYNLSTGGTTGSVSWGVGTGVITNVGDKYTIFYQ